MAFNQFRSETKFIRLLNVQQIILLKSLFFFPKKKHFYEKSFLFVECDRFTGPKNGNIVISANGTLAQYSCNVGYSLYGSMSLTCDGKDVPTDTTPSCG